MLYQYIGQGHTMVKIVEGEPKTKVVNGEVIESDLEEKYFTKNGFQKIDYDEAQEVTEDEVIVEDEIDLNEEEIINKVETEIIDNLEVGITDNGELTEVSIMPEAQEEKIEEKTEEIKTIKSKK